MPVQLLEPVLPPEPRTVIGDKERRSEYARLHGILEILLIGLGTSQQPTVGQRRIKTRRFQARLDHGIVGHVLFVGPAGARDCRHQSPQYTPAGLLRRD